MARKREEAWVTYVATEDAVTTAMILAASLRLTRTTRKISVILSREVSKEAGKILREGFDDTFLLDDHLVGTECGGGFRKEDQLRGKIFAFSLEVYKKCIYLAPTTLVLENCDDLFEYRDGQDLRMKDFSGDMDIFLFTPRLALCEFLEGCRKKGEDGDFLGNHVSIWLRNNSISRIERQKENCKLSVGRFSVKSGRFVKGELADLKMIIFADIPKMQGGMVDKLKSLWSDPRMGLTEKAIVGKWMNLFEEQVARCMVDHYTAFRRKKEHYEQILCENEPIAIVGMSCRFPGAENLEELWKLLDSGKEGISAPPRYRWKKEHSIYGGSQKERETNAGFLTVPVDEFDSKFFGVSPKEAVFLDPQARLLHEVMWEGLEDGGIDPLSLRGSHTGIFTGSWMNDYKDIVQTSAERDFFRIYMGNSVGATAARLSFLLGLTGPSIATESGCSSAIVAVDLAVKSLRNGETSLAIAGGVNLLLHPFKSDLIDYVISPDGRCKTFDEKANGFGRAEGCGVLVLKRLNDALQDRDHIWAVIRGSAISQEGLSRSLGTPTVYCEALAMQLALGDAGVRPEQVSFVETHGTGTSVGDPMEVAAITKVYHSTARKDPLIIGSVKTNVGHTESCSGITGIIKTVLALQHEIIPKHLNFDTLNPEINLDAIPAKIPLEPVLWPKVPGESRIAGVSSFGITGTDGHVVIEDAPEYSLPKFTVGLERPLHLIKFSAKSKETLDEMLQKYEALFRKEQSGLLLSDLAYSSNTGRASFNHRAFLIAKNVEEAAAVVQSNGLIHGDISGKDPGKICFLFPGQGSQYEGMAKTLYESSPTFRFYFDHCDTFLRDRYNLSLRQVLWDSDEKSNQLSRTMYSQTSIFCVEYCLLKLWESWGIQPDCVLGHSLGEFCAAVAAGILTFEDALMLVAERSRLIDSLPRGSMLVMKASQPEVEKLMKNANIDLDYGAVNSAEQTMVAGDTKEIQKFLDVCQGNSVKAVILAATHAFHSRHMDPVLKQYRKIAATIKYSSSLKCEYVSGMRGILVPNAASITADYWVAHTREKVSFLDACNSLKQLNCQHFVEIGPHPVLSTFVLQNIDNQPVSCYPSLRRNTNDWDTILTSLGKLYLNGVNVDWEGYDKPYLRRKVPSYLPFHPFHRKPFWTDCSPSSLVSVHPLIGSPLSNASALNIFQNNLNLKTVPFLKDHCIGARIVMPAAGFAEMCLAAGHCVTNSLTESLDRPIRPLALENLTIEAPLALAEGKLCRLQVIVDLPEFSAESTDRNSMENGFRIKIFCQNTVDNDPTGKWELHASSTFHPVVTVKDILNKWEISGVKELISTSESTSTHAFYKRIDGVGLKFGDLFKSIEVYWGNPGGNKKDEIVAQVKLPPDQDNYLLHPIVLDAMIQTVILSSLQTQTEVLTVPTRIGKLVWLNDAAKSSSVLYLHATWENDNCSIFAADDTFNPIAFMTDVQLIETNVRTIESILEQQNRSLPDSWEETWKPIPGPLDNRVNMPRFKAVLDSDKFSQRLQQVDTVVPHDFELNRNTKRLLYLYQVKALQKLGWNPVKNEVIDVPEFCEKHHILPMYHQLVHHYFTVCQDEGMMTFNKDTNSWKIESVPPPENKLEMEITPLVRMLESEEKVAVVSQVYRTLGERLHRILRGEESALQLLFPPGDHPQQQGCSADLYYQNHPCRSDAVAKTGEILRKICQNCREATQNNPKAKLRVLEVGAGTGSLSQVALAILAEEWGREFEYYYTDISGSFFAKAEKKLEGFQKNIRYCVFDLEKGALSQGIPVNYFDLVLGTDVLHATRSLEESVGNIKDILKPSGVLLCTETVIQDRGITFVFGLLEGYWRFRDFAWRPRHACVGIDTWRRILLQGGFDYVHGAEAFLGTVGVITAQTAKVWLTPPTVTAKPAELGKWVVFGDLGDDHWELILRLTRYGANHVTLVLSSKSREDDKGRLITGNVTIRRVDTDAADLDAQIDTILSADPLYAIIYGWGGDIEKRDQRHIARPFFHLAKKLLTLKNPPKLFLFTRGIQPVNPDLQLVSNPAAATLFGMAKALKNENSDLLVRYIDVEGETGNGREQGALLDAIMYELGMYKEAREKDRVQVAYREGQRYEPRFSPVNVRTKLGEELKLPLGTSRYQLVLPSSRTITDLTYDVLGEESVGAREVEVQVRAYALNFRDLFTILKPLPEFEKLNAIGKDFAGVVTKVGRGVPEDHWKMGDAVFGFNTREVPLHSHLMVDSSNIMKIPANLTFAEACTLPVVFATSLYSLVDVAQMKKGETVLIHTGSGGVGLAAIQIARQVGANIITTAGSPRKQVYLRSLGIEHVFHSRNTAYREEILKVTQGRGVDIVLNSITGPGFKEASLDVTAKNGRFVEMSKLAVWTEEEVKERRPDVKYTIVDLTDKKQFSWDQVAERLEGSLREGTVHPIPHVTFDGLRIRQALQFLQRAKHIGKVVVTMPEMKAVEGQWRVTVPLFNDRSTYVITGGLGGIGFEVCKWMLEKGATDIVLLGRSPPKPEVAQEIDRLNNSSKGFNVGVKLGDVGNYEECKKMFEEILGNCGDKPLRGIQHCAGVLRDNMYVNQTWEDFEATFNPKVEGTWNLHHLTRHLPLEHFVLYSSITALAGTPSQANHAAANCFEDAFAHYRYSLGLPATSINWGQWAQVGCAKEINLTGVLPVSVKRMLKGLEVAIRSQSTQVSFGDFESLHMWTMVCPTFKYYLDEKLVKSMSKGRSQSANVLLKTDQFWKEVDGADGKPEKMEVVTRYMKAILRGALRMEAEEVIDENVNMQDLGVDSLMLIELKNSIQGLMGSRFNVTANMLKDCHTIRDLSTVLVNKICDDEENPVKVPPLSPEEYTQLLEADCILEEDIRPASPSRPVTEMKTVLITGVTGQLGPYILSKLGEPPYNQIEKIVCLIRTKEGKCPKEKLRDILASMNLTSRVDLSQVECVRGDVTHPQFGLSEAVYKNLTESMDGVIHLAAKSNHVEVYRKCGENTRNIRSVNVEGTRNILRFAATGKTKCVYYASSIMSVFGGNNEDHLCDDWPETDQITFLAANAIPGYAGSKFVCEILLKQANERGIPCKAFRFPWILGDSSTGQLNYQNNHYILRFLSYLKIRSMPTFPIPAIVLPVDTCADLSLKLFWSEDAPNEIYNVAHPNPQTEVEFMAVAKEHFGVELELVEWKSKEFTEKLYAKDMPLEALKQIYENVDMGISAVETDAFKAVHGYLNSPINFFSNPKVSTFLPGFSHEIPSSMEIILQNLLYVKSKDFFKKFGV